MDAVAAVRAAVVEGETVLHPTLAQQAPPSPSRAAERNNNNT